MAICTYPYVIEIIENIQNNDALIFTAPPGWGKTYKFLDGIKKSNERVVFIFPLRALCDEVYISALELKINVVNIRKEEDYDLVKQKKSSLIICTPETFRPFTDSLDTIYILDEFHLFYYWGDSFRERLSEVYMQITSYSFPVIFLSATLSEELLKRLNSELSVNYEHIYHIDMGNQKLKNLPGKLFYYPAKFHNYLDYDLKYSDKKGTTLVFCKYRKQVAKLSKELREQGDKVLSCVGGEAAQFIQNLSVSRDLDFIVATSVVSHGVNLPGIKRVYFMYRVENLDFYLQMLGRGGRDGESFEVHTLSDKYFHQKELWIGIIRIFIKRLSNKTNYLLYSLYDN